MWLRAVGGGRSRKLTWKAEGWVGGVAGCDTDDEDFGFYSEQVGKSWEDSKQRSNMV